MPCPAGGAPIAVAVLRAHADDHEPVEPAAVRGEHAHGPVAGVDVPHRGLHDVVQGRLELTAGGGRAQGGGEHRRDVDVGATGQRPAVGRGHGPTVGGAAGTGSGPGASGRERSGGGRGGVRPHGRVVAGRRPGHRLPQQGLAAGPDDDEVGALGCGRAVPRRRAARGRRSACGRARRSRRSPGGPGPRAGRGAARCARTSDAARALQRIAVRCVEDADGDDGRLAPRGLAQRPHQGAVAGGRAVHLDDAATGSAGGAAAGGRLQRLDARARGLVRTVDADRPTAAPSPGPTPAPARVGCRSCRRSSRAYRDYRQGPRARAGTADRCCTPFSERLAACLHGE